MNESNKTPSIQVSLLSLIHSTQHDGDAKHSTSPPLISTLLRVTKRSVNDGTQQTPQNKATNTTIRPPISAPRQGTVTRSSLQGPTQTKLQQSTLAITIRLTHYPHATQAHRSRSKTAPRRTTCSLPRLTKPFNTVCTKLE
jgi:hypothetical protein